MTQSNEAEEPSIEELEQELTRVKPELEDYQGLIEELPAIYERKFRQQLGDVAQDIRRLLDERQSLQEQLRQALACGQQPEAPSTLATAPVRSIDLLTALLGRRNASASTFSAPSRRWLLLIAAITTLMVAALAASLGLWRRSRVPQLATPAAPPTAPQTATPTPASKLASQSAPDIELQLRLRFNGECWIEVQTLDGETVLVKTFQDGETRSLPLGEGLRVQAGRPDLLEVAVGEGDFRTFGAIDRINWVVIRPPDMPEGSS